MRITIEFILYFCIVPVSQPYDSKIITCRAHALDCAYNLWINSTLFRILRNYFGVPQ